MSVKSVKRKVKAVWYLTIAASLVVAPRRKGFLAHFDLPRWIIFIQQHKPVRLHRLLSILSSFLNWNDMIRLGRIFNKKECFPLVAFDQVDVEKLFPVFFLSSINTSTRKTKKSHSFVIYISGPSKQECFFVKTWICFALLMANTFLEYHSYF